MLPTRCPRRVATPFHNFVLPANLTKLLFVRAIEFRTDNPQVIHHAWMTVDRKGSCRKLDAADPAVGFGGMDMGYSRPPDGHFLGWTPGKVAVLGPSDTSWPLGPGHDLVLQLHMRPTGKPERVSPRIGIYFSDRPPTKFPYMLLLKVRDLNIPAGEKNFIAETTFELPVDADLLSIYPHAHYVCREMHIVANVPGEGRKPLLVIPQWDFNWQDQYDLIEPIRLPAGSQIHMKYVYDNSTDNVRNPNNPPKDVAWGDGSDDEMGSLGLQLLPSSRSDYTALQLADVRHAAVTIGTYRDYYNYGNILQKHGRHREAIVQYQKSLQIRSDHPLVHHNLAGSLASLGKVDEAIRAMQESIRLDPNYAPAHCNLGNFWFHKKDYQQAARCYRRTLQIDPQHAEARHRLRQLQQRAP